MKGKKIALGIIIAFVVIAVAAVLLFVRGVARFFGYRGPVERYQYKVKTDLALEKKYPGHDFGVDTELSFGEYGYYLVITATDENGIDFRVQWIEDEIEDYYHEEWNKFFYGEKIVEYQNALRDEYFPQISYVDTYEDYPYDAYHFYRGSFKEVFFEDMEDAIEGSKDNSFDTNVTFKEIDLDTADDDELESFAASIADSLIWLYRETGYYDIRINTFHYRGYDESGAPVQSRDEIIESVIKKVKLDRKIKADKEAKSVEE